MRCMQCMTTKRRFKESLPNRVKLTCATRYTCSAKRNNIVFILPFIHIQKSHNTQQSTEKGCIVNTIAPTTNVFLRAVVRENRGFFLKFGKCDRTNFDETLHI